MASARDRCPGLVVATTANLQWAPWAQTYPSRRPRPRARRTAGRRATDARRRDGSSPPPSAGVLRAARRRHRLRRRCPHGSARRGHPARGCPGALAVVAAGGPELRFASMHDDVASPGPLPWCVLEMTDDLPLAVSVRGPGVLVPVGRRAGRALPRSRRAPKEPTAPARSLSSRCPPGRPSSGR